MCDKSHWIEDFRNHPELALSALVRCAILPIIARETSDLREKIEALTFERDYHRQNADLLADSTEEMIARARIEGGEAVREAAKQAQPCTLADAVGSYERGHLAGVMDYAKGIRALDVRAIVGGGDAD